MSKFEIKVINESPDALIEEIAEAERIVEKYGLYYTAETEAQVAVDIFGWMLSDWLEDNHPEFEKTESWINDGTGFQILEVEE